MSQRIEKLLDQALTHHIAIVGRTGSGKTYLSMGAIERKIDTGEQCVIMDPTGVWWGLPLNNDGSPSNKRSHVVVVGGEHGHIGIPDPDLLAKWIVDRRVTCVIDTSEMLSGERHLFAERFFEALYRYNRSPLHLVIDEADEFARQNPLPETKRLFHQVDRIVRRGRVRGFRVLMITQRPAVLHKDVLTQAGALVMMKLTSPQDRGAIKAWIEGQADTEEGKQILGALPRLKLGEGWIWIPEVPVLEKFKGTPNRSFDSSATPEGDGGRGVEAGAHRGAAAAEIARELAVLIAQTEKAAEAPPAAHTEHLAEADARARVAEDFAERAREAALTRVRVIASAARVAVMDALKPLREALEAAETAMTDTITTAEREALEALDVPRGTTPTPQPAPPGRTAKAAPAARVEVSPSTGGGRWASLPAAARIQHALRAFGPLTKAQIATLACIRKSGSYDTYISRLHRDGWIKKDGDSWRLVRWMGGAAVTPTFADILNTMSRIEGRATEMAVLLWQRGAMSRDALATLAGIKRSGSFDTYLSRLRSAGIIQNYQGGKVGISDLLIDKLGERA